MSLFLNGQEVRPFQTVTFYTCGITPYARSHIGHARVFVVCDAIKRIMSGLLHCLVLDGTNITDVDDKIIEGATSAGESIGAFAGHYIQAHEEAMRRLNVRKECSIVRVTDCIPEIIAFIQKLVGTGSAIVTHDGVRMQTPPSFSLWKTKPHDEVGWQSPWGWGRPGWHIECSTITALLFGKSIDFHAGGADLAMPHHANESRQNHAFWGHDSVRSYLHIGALQVQGLKMSKSLKNFWTIDDCLVDHCPQAIRMMFLMTKWKTPLAYSQHLMSQAAALWESFQTFLRLPYKQGIVLFEGSPSLATAKTAVREALLTDADTATALLTLADVVHRARNNTVPLHAAQRLVSDTLTLLGFTSDIPHPPHVLDIRQQLRGVALMPEARAVKDSIFKITDEIRRLFPCEDNDVQTA